MGTIAVRAIAFCAGFIATLAFEMAMLFGWQQLMGGHWHPVGLGWAIMPFSAGAGCAAMAKKWLDEIDRRRSLLKSRRERAKKLGPGWQGNPVEGLKAPQGKRWQIVGTWPPSDNEGTSPQMAQEAPGGQGG